MVTVSGGSAAVGGSTTVPVPSTSTDYVVQLHLTGAQAAMVYNNAAYNATTTSAPAWTWPMGTSTSTSTT